MKNSFSSSLFSSSPSSFSLGKEKETRNLNLRKSVFSFRWLTISFCSLLLSSCFLFSPPLLRSTSLFVSSFSTPFSSEKSFYSNGHLLLGFPSHQIPSQIYTTGRTINIMTSFQQKSLMQQLMMSEEHQQRQGNEEGKEESHIGEEENINKRIPLEMRKVLHQNKIPKRNKIKKRGSTASPSLTRNRRNILQSGVGILGGAYFLPYLSRDLSGKGSKDSMSALAADSESSLLLPQQKQPKVFSGKLDNYLNDMKVELFGGMDEFASYDSKDLKKIENYLQNINENLTGADFKAGPPFSLSSSSALSSPFTSTSTLSASSSSTSNTASLSSLPTSSLFPSGSGNSENGSGNNENITTMMTTKNDKPLPLQRAYFALGCYWGAEAAFRCTKGVVGTRVGFMGGDYENPTYHDVGNHLEAVEVIYTIEENHREGGKDEDTSFNRLLGIAARTFDFEDIGKRYNRKLFPVNQQQFDQIMAEESPWPLKKRRKTTDIQMASTTFFTEARLDHQAYTAPKCSSDNCAPNLALLTKGIQRVKEHSHYASDCPNCNLNLKDQEKR